MRSRRKAVAAALKVLGTLFRETNAVPFFVQLGELSEEVLVNKRFAQQHRSRHGFAHVVLVLGLASSMPTKESRVSQLILDADARTNKAWIQSQIVYISMKSNTHDDILRETIRSSTQSRALAIAAQNGIPCDHAMVLFPPVGVADLGTLALRLNALRYLSVEAPLFRASDLISFHAKLTKETLSGVFSYDVHLLLRFVSISLSSAVHSLPWRNKDSMLDSTLCFLRRAGQSAAAGDFDDPLLRGSVDEILPPLTTFLARCDVLEVTRHVNAFLTRPADTRLEFYETLHAIVCEESYVDPTVLLFFDTVFVNPLDILIDEESPGPLAV